MKRVREKELQNSEQQKAFYEAEIDRLNKRIEDMSGVEKVLQLEEEVGENNDRISELRKIYKDLEKVKKENGETLERLTSGDVYANKMKQFIVELKIWKDKQDRLERKYAASDEVEEKQVERQARVQNEIDELKSKIAEEAKNEEPDKPQTDRREDLDKVMEEKELVKKDYEENKDELAKDRKARAKDLKEKRKERDIMANRLRELDQESRISELKYKDIKRKMRHNHLKPISRAGSAAAESTGR